MAATRVRRKDKEVVDPAAVLDVLRRGEVARLAMISDGGPYVVPVSYALLPAEPGEPLRLAVHAAREGRKIDALRKDPRVCVEVTVDVQTIPAVRACDVGVRYRSVIAFGRAVFLEEPAARMHALAAIAERYAPGSPPVDAGEAKKIAVLELRIDEATCKQSPPARS